MDDAQLQMLVEQWRKQLDKQMSEMKLRQWCVEMAIKTCEAGAPGAEHYSDIYENILTFVSAPFSDVFREAGNGVNQS